MGALAASGSFTVITDKPAMQPHTTQVERMSVNSVRSPAHGPAKQSAAPGERTQSALGECVARSVRRYLADIGDTPCKEGLHALVLREVEAPLLREVLAFHDGNQSRAAAALGINRATLRKKLALLGLV